MSGATERPSPFDTIYAFATPGGVARRGVLRISGPLALSVVHELSGEELPRTRSAQRRQLRLWGEFHSVALPAMCLVFPGPASYTGEDIVELHSVSSPPIAELLAEQLRRRGVRRAERGEFTRRAFQNGKLGLAQAEAVIAFIRARDDESLRRAGALLLEDSNVAANGLRERLLGVLALLEGGLDFEAFETGAVEVEAWLPELRSIARTLAGQCAQSAAVGAETALPSFVLLGPANAGKTSLWNLLRDPETAFAGLVSDMAGTTRDLRWAVCGMGRYRLADSPGRDVHRDAGEDQELRILRQELALTDGYVWMSPADAPMAPPTELGTPLLLVNSRSDLTDPGGVSAGGQAFGDASELACSVRTGHGVAELRAAFQSMGRRGTWAEDWASLVRGRLREARDAAARATASAEAGLGAECVAAELHDAVAALDPVDAAAVPEALLDRIFASFCLGK